MTPPVSGGLPEQGLREALDDLSSDGCVTRAIARYLARAPGITYPSADGIKGILEPLWAALARPRPALPAALALGLTMDELAAALDDVLEKTAWEGKGKHIAPALLAALKSRSRPALPAPEARMGYVLAMAVLQSDAWASADDELRAAVEHFTTGAALPAEHAPPDAT